MAKTEEATPVALTTEQVLEYLTSQVTADEDGPAKGKPFIDDKGVHIHTDDWMHWLGEQGLTPTKREAVAPLRALGLVQKQFRIPGESRAPGFWTGKVTGTSRLPKRSKSK